MNQPALFDSFQTPDGATIYHNATEPERALVEKLETEMDINDPILVPLTVAKCPSCLGEVMVDPLSWREHEDGIEVCEFHLYCAGEDYESKDWRRQHGMAYEMPYVYWLSQETKAEKWLATVRFTDRVAEQKKLTAWNTHTSLGA